jgi:hypothetical protein
MFTIRKEQAEAYRAEMMNSFEQRAVAHLREHLPELTARSSDPELTERIRSCVPRARAHGLTTETQIAHFVNVTLLAGQDFDRDPSHPWASDVLENSRLTADEKSTLLVWIAWNLHKEQMPHE